jgi:hypothetical protein
MGRKACEVGELEEVKADVFEQAVLKGTVGGVLESQMSSLLKFTLQWRSASISPVARLVSGTQPVGLKVGRYGYSTRPMMGVLEVF